MKKILVFILLSILIFTVVGCNKEVSAEEITNSTKEVWDNSTQNETVEQLSFKNLNIGGIVTIDNLVFDIEKKIKEDKIFLNIETRKNMSVKINENVKDIINMFLDYKNLQGNLKVKHLEQAWSKVGLRVNLQLDKNSVDGIIEVLNVKDMFKENLTKPATFDIKLNDIAENEAYKSIYHELKCHPIASFFPTNKDSFNVNKEVPISFDSHEICCIANGFICNNCDKKLGESELTVKHILFDAFADTNAEEIFKNVLSIENPTAKFNLITKNDKKFIDGMNIKSKIKINISKNQLETIAKDLTDAYNNEKLFNIYSSVINLLDYENALIEGDMEYSATNRIIK